MTGVREALAVWALATAACSALYWIGLYGVGFVHRHLHELVAVLFWGIPTVLLERRGEDLRRFGWTARPLGRHLGWAALAALVLFPPFVVGFAWWHGALGRLGALTPRLHPDPLFPLTHLIVVALPEEFFFRGYLLGRLREAWPGGVRLGGVRLGPAVLVSSLLFALGHYLVDFVPARMAVFFPALAFAWLRERTGSIAPGVIFHALCNVLQDALYRSLV